jgi:hypothetical protein
MVAAKKQIPVTQTLPGVTRTGRKAWVRRTPVDVVLAQITKQQERVAALQEELAKEKRALEKLEAARKVLEST